MSVTVRAAAKVNLHLGVGPLRTDGYHPLVTVYQAIGLYADLTVAPAQEWQLSVEPSGPIDCAEVPLDERNLAIRAARLLLEHHRREDACRLHLVKGIPVAGGLAGGSADAAAALLGVDRLFDLETSDEDLLALAATLGSDVPFALLGGTALGTGRGELVEPVESGGPWWWVVVPAPVGLSTPEVYAAYDSDPAESAAPADALLAAVRQHDPSALGALLHNDLQAPAVRLRPDVGETLELLRAAGPAGVLLSGSGPTCLALAADADAARDLAGVVAETGRTALVAPAPVPGAHVVEYA